MTKFSFRPDPSLVRIFSFLKNHKLRLALASIFLAGAASMSSLTATLLGRLTDLGFYQGESWVVWGAPAALIGVSLLYAVSTVMSTVIMSRISQSILCRLRKSLFARMLHWPEETVEAHTTGEVASRFVNEAAVALGGAADAFVVLVRDSLQVLALLCVLFWHNPLLALTTLVIVPALAVVLHLISRRMKRIVRTSQESVAHMISRVGESFGAQKLIKISGAYAHEEARFAGINARIRAYALKAIKMQGAGTPVTHLLTMVAVAFVVAAALYESQQGRLTFGEFITFLSALLLLRQPIQSLAGLNATFASTAAAAKSVFDLLDLPVELDSGRVVLGHVKGRITFEDVTFVYPGTNRAALEGVTLEIPAGSRTAVVGASGSGKSTLTSLIARLRKPVSGRVLIDGVDVQDATLTSLRRQISMVAQTPDLFDDTIRANLIFGLSPVRALPDHELYEALEAADLADFVRALPDGLDTRVGVNGSLLSGGQKQRLAIARAVLKRAPILILDEAASALDAASEAAVKAGVEHALAAAGGATLISIAHRLHSVRDADQIVVFDKGRIVETGTHDALMAIENGFYRRLVESQAAEGTGGTGKEA